VEDEEEDMAQILADSLRRWEYEATTLERGGTWHEHQERDPYGKVLGYFPFALLLFSGARRGGGRARP
jgi:hypothetical protein